MFVQPENYTATLRMTLSSSRPRRSSVRYTFEEHACCHGGGCGEALVG
jgi:hypothetical protein